MKRRNPKRATQYKTPRYTEILERVGANVRKLREARGWTQEEAAFQCNDMSASMLRTIEGGRVNITATTLARLCDGLDVDIGALFLPAKIIRRKSGRPKKAKEAEAEEKSAD